MPRNGKRDDVVATYVQYKLQYEYNSPSNGSPRPVARSTATAGTVENEIYYIVFYIEDVKIPVRVSWSIYRVLTMHIRSI